MTKPTFEAYSAWTEDSLGFNVLDEQVAKRYASNARLIKSFVESSETWSKFIDCSKSISDNYKNKTGYSLFSTDTPIPDLKIKPFDSVVEKMFRSNILENKTFPEPPFIKLTSAHEWVVEDNLYRSINDIVRGRMICRYMDGPEYFCQEMHEAIKHLASVDFHSMETDLGYYSWHFGLTFALEIMKPNGNVSGENVRVEVQISTQLQDVMNDLTHSFYEDKRVSLKSDSIWKWRPDQPKFQGVYFGHTLHMIEGMLVQLKNKIAEDGGAK